MSNFKSLMKMPQSKLVSKCLALEEMLSRYHEFETVHYDLQSKYQILIDKYERICKKNQQISDIHTTASQSNKKDKSDTEIGERIEIYALEDIETTQLIKSLQDQNSRMQEQLKQSQIEYEKLKFKFDQKYSSPEKDNSEGLISTLKNEISRLNKLVSHLRLELSIMQNILLSCFMQFNYNKQTFLFFKVIFEQFTIIPKQEKQTKVGSDYNN